MHMYKYVRNQTVCPFIRSVAGSAKKELRQRKIFTFSQTYYGMYKSKENFLINMHTHHTRCNFVLDLTFKLNAYNTHRSSRIHDALTLTACNCIKTKLWSYH